MRTRRFFFFLLLAACMVPSMSRAASDPPNTPPTISAIGRQVVQQNSSLGAIAFTINDAETPAASLTLSASSTDTSVIAVTGILFGGSGTARTFSLTPDSNRAGTLSVIITVSDGSLTASDTVTVKVNLPPRLDSNTPLTVLEGATGAITSTLLQTFDDDNTPSQIIYTVGPDSASGVLAAHGAVLLAGSFVGLGGTFSQADVDNHRVTYMHDHSETTDDFFTFTVTDSDGGIASDNGHAIFHFNVSVTPVNDPPAARDTSFTIPVGFILKSVLPAGDPDSPVLTYSVVMNGSKGTLTIDSVHTGEFSYRPDSAATGSDTVIFQVYDSALYSVHPGLVHFTIAYLPPVVYDGNATILEGGVLLDTLGAMDPNHPPSPLVFSLAGNLLNGTIELLDSTKGIFRYTPMADFFGIDTVRFHAKAGNLNSSEGLFMVTVRPKAMPGDVLIADSHGRKILLHRPLPGQTAIVTSGDSLLGAVGVVVEPNGEIYALDSKTGILKIDPSTGAQTKIVPISSFTPSPIGPTAITLEHNGMLLIADGPGGIKRINPWTHEVTVAASGDSLGMALGVAVGRSGDIYVGDGSAFIHGTSKILKINPVSGSQSVVSYGGNLRMPVGLVLDDSDRIFVADPAKFAGGPADLIMRVDPASGVQTILVSGDTLSSPTGIGLGIGGNLLVANQGKANILSVDTSNGKVSVELGPLPQFQPFSLTVVHATPLFLASKSVIRFPHVATGAHATDSLMVENTGTAPLFISSVASDSAEFVVTPAGGTVAPSSSKKFYVTFTPATSDSITATVTFASNAFDSPFLLRVSGRGTVTGVHDAGLALPARYALYRGYPNPFNPSTTIRFDLPRSSSVSFRVYDVLGRLIEERTKTVYEAGEYSFRTGGSSWSSGMYFVVMDALPLAGSGAGYHSVEKVLLIK